MKPIVKAYQKRLCSQEEFCNKHQINKAVLQYWISKLNRSEVQSLEPAFQPMKVIKELNDHIEIKTQSGMIIRIPIA